MGEIFDSILSHLYLFIYLFIALDISFLLTSILSEGSWSFTYPFYPTNLITTFMIYFYEISNLINIYLILKFYLILSDEFVERIPVISA